jgi:hypothetical protein
MAPGKQRRANWRMAVLNWPEKLTVAAAEAKAIQRRPRSPGAAQFLASEAGCAATLEVGTDFLFYTRFPNKTAPNWPGSTTMNRLKIEA